MIKRLICFLMWVFSCSVFAENRFQAPTINAPADAFMLSQTSSSNVNSSYLKVAIKNRLQRKIKEKLKAESGAANDANNSTRNTSIQQGVFDQAGLLTVDNSVIVLPGAIDFASEVTIVNIQSNTGKSTVGLFE